MLFRLLSECRNIFKGFEIIPTDGPEEPGFGILTHVGRKSGKVYRTPVNVFQVPDGFIIALTYSSQSEWVKNVLAVRSCELRTRGKKYQLTSPKVVHGPQGGSSHFPSGLC